MKRVQDSMNEARRNAYGSMSESINLFSKDYAAGGDTLELELDVTGITPGMVLSSGLNVWWVKNVSSSARVVYVIPGFDGSPEQSANAGDVLMVKPRVTDWHLFNLVRDAIQAMSSRTYGLYRQGSWVQPWGGPHNWTATIPAEASDMLGLTRVSFRPSGYDTYLDVRPQSIKVNKAANQIHITDERAWGCELRFDYRAPFTLPLNPVWDLVWQVGLGESMLDIPALGAAAALLRTTENRRSQISVQGDPRRADEVPVGSNSSAARDMQRAFKDRCNDEYIRLVNNNPIMIGV